MEKTLLSHGRKSRPLDLEDIDFLKKLQLEMTECKTYQAQPRFWVVAQDENRPCADGYDDHTEYQLESNQETRYLSLEELVKDCLDELPEDLDYEDIGAVENRLGERIEEIPIETVHDVVVENTFFLTRRECEEHIAANYYHYNKTVHPWCMSAWRSPQVERLFEILSNVDFDGGDTEIKSVDDTIRYKEKEIDYDEVEEVLEDEE